MEHSLTNPKPTNEDAVCTYVEKWLPDHLWHLSLSMSSASQVASTIDLLIEILMCLPVKSLLMFKSVSKHWLSLISDSHLSSKHFIQSSLLSAAGLFALEPKSCSSNVQCFFLDGRSVPSGSDNPFESINLLNNTVPEMMILQSGNGLLLCRSGRFRDKPNNLNYLIYNPCTRQCRTLSSLPRFQFSFSTPISVSLAFDPLKSPHYKLVCIWKGGESNQSKIHMYSSETNSWRLSDYQFDASKCIFRNSGVFWNGSLNWIDYYHDEAYSYCYIIDQELVKRVPLPPIHDRCYSTSIIYFGECMGHLYFIERDCEWLPSVDVLEMETDFSGWSVKYCVNLEGLPTVYPEAFDNSSIPIYANYKVHFHILLVREEEDHLRFVILLPDGKVVSLNTKEEYCLKEIHNLGPNFYKGGAFVHQFIESLAEV